HAVHERVEKRLLRDGDRQDALSVSLIHPVFELLLPFLGQGDPPSPPLIPREDSLQGLRLAGSFDHVVHLDLRRGVRNDRQNVAEVHDADALTHQSLQNLDHTKAGPAWGQSLREESREYAILRALRPLLDETCGLLKSEVCVK